MRYSKTVLMFVLVTLLGCGASKGGPDATVQGTVTVDGVLAERGTVSFYPVKEGPIAIGTINPDGTFALKVGRGNVANTDFSKIHSGEYLAAVVVLAQSTVEEDHPEMPPTPGARLSAKRFSQKGTSDLSFKVTAGLNILPIDLKGSANDPVEETEAETPVTPEGNGTDEDKDNSTPFEESSTEDEKNTEVAQ